MTLNVHHIDLQHVRHDAARRAGLSAYVSLCDESAPEGRNLHLKFKLFSGVTPPDRTSTARDGDPLPHRFRRVPEQASRCWDRNYDDVGRPVLTA